MSMFHDDFIQLPSRRCVAGKQRRSYKADRKMRTQNAVGYSKSV